MKMHILSIIILHVALITRSATSERVFPGNSYSHREYLDPEGKFILEWIADPKKSDVLFNITAETLGYVALGFSKTGMMAKADMVVTGVNDKGKPYLSDRYTKMDSRFPIEDIEQNWKVIDAFENETHTSVSLRRDMDTCDRQDWPLNDDTIYILWAYGEDDTFDYHFKNRGSYPTHILQPDLSPQLSSPQGQASSSIPRRANQRRIFGNSTRSRGPSSSSTSSLSSPSNKVIASEGSGSTTPAMESGLDVWRLTVTVNNSVANNEPWCVFQKGPELPKPHNIIGFSTSTLDEKVLKNLDRLVIYKCFPKQNQNSSNNSNPNNRRLQRQEEDQLQTRGQARNNDEESDKKFEELIDYSGECKRATELYAYCTDIIYTWGNGGRDIFLPKNVGVPFGEQDEHYLLESFLIPKSKNMSDDESKEMQSEQRMRKDKEFDVDVDFLLTENPRKYSARILKVGYDPMTPILIPPGATNFDVYGHCPNECSTKMIPRTKPVRVFGVSFDTGQAAKPKSVTLHHFRNAFEIPIILDNRNHDPKYQEMQILREETPVRPTDQLTVRCKFDSDSKPQMARIPTSSSNLSLQPSPRCLAYLWYYQDIPMNKSSPNMNMNDRQMLECTSKIHPSDFAIWVEENAPPEMKRNIDSPYILNKLKKLKWTQFLLLSLSELYEFGRYRASCGGPNPGQMTKNKNNRIGSAVSNINRGSNFNNGTNRRGPASQGSPSKQLKLSTASEITVYPLQVEEQPDDTMGGGGSDCSTFGGGSGNGRRIAGARAPPRAPPDSDSGELLYFGLPPLGPVMFGFPY